MSTSTLAESSQLGSAFFSRRSLRETQLTSAFLPLVVGLVAAVTWSYCLEFSTWRLDLMQAADRSGLYLFFLNPGYAAMSAWAAVRARQGLGDLPNGLPAPSLIWRRAWAPLAKFGLVAHAVVLALMVGTGLASHGIGSVDLYPVAVQFLSIPFFAGLGAMVGGWAPSRLTAPGVLLALLACNTLLIQFGFRRISEVGTGSADFIDLVLRTGYLTPKVVLFVSLSAFAWPARILATGKMRRIRSCIALLALVSFLYVYTASGDAQVYRPSTPVCHSDAGMRICVPADVVGHADAFDVPVARVRRLLTDLNVTIPSQIDVVSRGATVLRPHTVAITVTAPDLMDSSKIQRAVDFGFAYAQSCSDPNSQVGPPMGVIVTHGLLDGWLQQQTHSVQRGTYPEEELAALDKLPSASRDRILRRLFTQVWACRASIQPFKSDT